jgi:CBS domain-containing protein
MEISGTVRQILKIKGSSLYRIDPEAMVFDALKVMGEKNIGALVVLENGRVVGVFSERDYSRKVVLQGKTSRETRVSEVLSRPVITVGPDDGIEKCMELMTSGRVRHLPVVDGDEVCGLVSIGDVVNWIMLAQSHAIRQLKGYISGQYPV